MKIQINYGNGVCALPSRALEEKSAERTDLLALMYICSDPELAADIHALAKKIGCTQKKAESAVDLWLGAGIIEISDASDADGANEAVADTDPAERKKGGRASDADKAADTEKIEKAEGRSRFESRPQYDARELSLIMEREDGTVKLLVEECQRITGKIFSPTEAGKVAAMHEYLGLELEHILAIFTYCTNRGKRSVSYIEKTVYNLYDEGIDTAAKLEEYIKRKEEAESREAELRRLLGLGDRALVDKEREAFRLWQVERKQSDELIKRAYDETVTNTGKYTLAYMSKVLESWYMAGITTPEMADKASEAHRSENDKKKDAQKEKTGGSFDTDEFIEAAMRRSYGDMKKAKQDEKTGK